MTWTRVSYGFLLARAAGNRKYCFFLSASNMSTARRETPLRKFKPEHFSRRELKGWERCARPGMRIAMRFVMCVVAAVSFEPTLLDSRRSRYSDRAYFRVCCRRGSVFIRVTPANTYGPRANNITEGSLLRWLEKAPSWPLDCEQRIVK